MVIDEVEKWTAWKNQYSNIPKHIRIEGGRYVLDYSSKDTPE